MIPTQSGTIILFVSCVARVVLLPLLHLDFSEKIVDSSMEAI